MCYFRVVQKKGTKKEMFFNFGSRIIKLDIGQRRSSMRIEMDTKYILNFCLWEEHRFIRPKTEKKEQGFTRQG